MPAPSTTTDLPLPDARGKREILGAAAGVDVGQTDGFHAEEAPRWRRRPPRPLIKHIASVSAICTLPLFDYFRAAVTSISTSQPGSTSPPTCMVDRAGLLGCAGVPKKVAIAAHHAGEVHPRLARRRDQEDAHHDDVAQGRGRAASARFDLADDRAGLGLGVAEALDAALDGAPDWRLPGPGR